MFAPSQIVWTLGLALAGPAPAPPAESADEPKAGAPETAPEGDAPGTPTPDPQAEPAREAPADAAPEAEPAAPEPTAAPELEPTGGLDTARVEALRGEARALRDDLFKARARISQVTSKLFNAKVLVELRSNLSRFYDISDLTITIDGAPVYTRETGIDATGGPLVEIFAAPGSHELGVSANLVARRDRTYTVRFDQTFAFVVPEDSEVSTRLRIRETGNMWRFTKRKRGQYRLRADLRAKAKVKRGASASKPAAPSPASGAGGVKVSAGTKAPAKKEAGGK